MNELIKPNKLPAPPATAECDSDGCGCHALSSALGRRDFLKLSALAATGLAFAKLPVMAAAFTPSDFEQMIPADKKLSKEWIASLTARGQPLSAAGADLKYIGMPINGICTGQVYLGGDGQLWRWNLDASRDFAKDTAKGPRFMQPDVAHSPMSQGFALQVGSARREQVFSLNAKGFQNVTFTNHYPMATVDYADAAILPIASAEIARLDNDPSRPENERISFIVEGGR